MYKAVTLEEVLAARETRSARQRELQAKYGKPMVSFTMNIPGEVKRSALSDLAFSVGMLMLNRAMGTPLWKKVYWLDTGCEALYVFDHNPVAMKAICEDIEFSAPAGRLYDMDVLDEKGNKINRKEPRPCVICGQPAHSCSRSRAHAPETVQAVMRRILVEAAPWELGLMAKEALLSEVRITPKPGLVDGNNNGAHRDMDLPLMERSARALRPYFVRMARLGMVDPIPAYSLREIGLQAEAAMFKATGGVNTHRGCIYGFGILLAATCQVMVEEAAPDAVFGRAGQIAEAVNQACAKAADPKSTPSHGETVRQKFQAPGIREEAAAGFPLVQKGLRYLRDEIAQTLQRLAKDAQSGQKGLDAWNAGMCRTLLAILLQCSDTNLLYRGGPEGLAEARKWAERVLAASPGDLEQELLAMDQWMIGQNLSPGGCADLLAMVLLIRWCLMQSL